MEAESLENLLILRVQEGAHHSIAQSMRWKAKEQKQKEASLYDQMRPSDTHGMGRTKESSASFFMYGKTRALRHIRWQESGRKDSKPNSVLSSQQ